MYLLQILGNTLRSSWMYTQMTGKLQSAAALNAQAALLSAQRWTTSRSLWR